VCKFDPVHAMKYIVAMGGRALCIPNIVARWWPTPRPLCFRYAVNRKLMSLRAGVGAFEKRKLYDAAGNRTTIPLLVQPVA